MSALLAVCLVAICFAIAVWDMYVTFAHIPESTVSEIIQRWATFHPVIPLTVGLLLGHLFWPIRRL